MTNTSGIIDIDGATVLDGAPIEGERLVAVNGVRFAVPGQTDMTDPHGLVIEHVATRLLGPGHAMLVAEITVWMGRGMVSLTVAPDDVLTVDLSDHETAAMLRDLQGA